MSDDELNHDDLVAEAGSYDPTDDVDIDLSEAISFEPFDADNVPVRVVSAELAKGKQSGKPYIKVRWEVEGSHERAGTTLWSNINLTGKGAGFAFDDLNALGALDKNGEPVSRKNPSVKVSSLPGCVALATVRRSAPESETDEDGRGPDGYQVKAEIKRLKRYVEKADADLK